MSLKPRTYDKYVGIELEFLMPTANSNQRCKAAIDELRNFLVSKGLYPWIQVGYDLSLTPDENFPQAYFVDEDTGREVLDDDYSDHDFENWYGGDVPVEVRLLLKEHEVPFIVPVVLNLIKSRGGYVNKSCGLHVHLDMRRRDFRTSVLRLYDLQDTLKAMVPEDRKENTYCAFVPFSASSLDVYKGGDRYRAINTKAYSEHRTIEVRCHEGTLESDAIVNWVNYLINIVENKPSTKEEQAYVNSRLEKYNVPSLVYSL